MTGLKHTPGIWVLGESPEGKIHFPIYAGGIKIAFVEAIIDREQVANSTFREKLEEARANAELIAQAPETSAALISANARIASYEHDMKLLAAENARLKISDMQGYKEIDELQDKLAHAVRKMAEARTDRDECIKTFLGMLPDSILLDIEPDITHGINRNPNGKFNEEIAEAFDNEIESRMKRNKR